jgi:MSHA biogenesis protein MshJ
MKARLQALANRINARTLRERVMLFGAVAAAMVFLLHSLFLNPLLARQAALLAQISQQRDNLSGIDAEIDSKLKAFELDPDAAAGARLAVLDTETAQLSASLRAMQKGLVAPERIAPLFEAILKANGRLQLVSMRTLPPSPFNDGALPLGSPVKPQAAVIATAAAAAAIAASPPQTPEAAAVRTAAAAPSDLLYRHGVELTVRGNYLDMVDYLDALEAMPTQLFWARAFLDVEQYPNARLSLTVYTLSLDKKWMKL